MIKNSIVKRWMTTVLAGIIIFIVITCIAICVVLKEQYYNSVRMTLNSHNFDTAIRNFTVSDESNNGQFIKSARQFIDNFSDKNLMEVWVIDKNGNVVLSSTGFSVNGEEYPDYNYASTTENGKGEWIGHMKNGEKIMAVTYLIHADGSDAQGAVRYIISLQDIDRQLYHLFILISFFGLVFISFVIISGAFFINSIINPVKKINETAEKIAKGDFNVSIDKYKYNDEIGHLCETINNMAKEIGETEQMKNEFISTVSHELRTPLTAIKGWGETVRSAKDDDEIVDKGISVIVSESERLTQLVEELLDFSRMESGKMSLKIAQMDIGKELSEIMQVFQERSERESIKLVTDIPNHKMVYSGDKNKLKQAFVNIVDNSFKYNKKGGFVKVEIEDTQKYFKIIISDNGCGISKNDLPRVREKFFKANKSVRGNGIGLSVTDEIIKMHGGEMVIESKPGIGTKTTLILPRKK